MSPKLQNMMGKIETFLEGKNLGNYFDTKFTVTAGKLHVKEIMSTKPHYHKE